MLQRQRIILIVIAVALGLVAVLMVRSYLQQQRALIKKEEMKKLEKEQANLTSVLVASKDIPPGSAITPDSLEINIIPNQFVQPRAVTSLERIMGMIVVAPILKGEQITLSKLSWSGERKKTTLSTATPVGKRAITISVTNIAALMGMLKPGDYVDVIAMIPVPTQTAEGKTVTQPITVPLFQNVLVLAVGQEIGAPSIAEESRYGKKEEVRRIEPSPLITLALTPQEANIIAFVQEQGKIRLILRSPADSRVEPLQPANWETVFQYILPKNMAKKDAQEKEPKVIEYVEIYRGLSKERIPLKE